MPSQPNHSLIHGLAVLQAIAGAGTALGSREVGRRLGLTHTRANRLLMTLAELGLVAQDANRKYHAGPGIHVLAAHSLRGSRLLPAALPELRALRAEGLTVALGTLWRQQVSYLIHARIEQTLDEGLGAHEIIPAAYSSIGMALLSCQPEPIAEPVPEPGQTLPTLAVGEDFHGELARARQRGWAVRRFADGTTSVGVALGSNSLVGLAVSSRHLADQALPALATRLQGAAERISTALNPS